MSPSFERPLVAVLRHELNALRGDWFWFVLLGLALVVLGTIALGSVVIASLATAVSIVPSPHGDGLKPSPCVEGLHDEPKF